MADYWPTSGFDLHLELDPAAGRRSGLEHALRTAVRDGRLATGARLPATRELAAELGLSRGTVRAAYDQLVAEGYLTARQGSGTVVARLPEQRVNRPAHDRKTIVPRHDLRPGSPDVASFPTSAWLRSTRRALGAASAEAFGYGDPRGRIELRTALAGYLGRTRGVLADPARIVVTNGYVQALSLLSQSLNEMVTGAGGTATIAMEDPGVALHRDVARRGGSTVVPLPVDHHGARIDLLASPGFRAVDAVVVTPAHQYPTGQTLHPTRRRALTGWARSGGGLIVENDYDGEFRYDRQPVGAVQGTAGEHVAYLGTASKALGPALRLGWMVLPRQFVEPVVEAKRHSDHHTETIGQLTLADLLAGHAYDRHVRACRLRYRRRRDLLLDLLRRDSGRSPASFPVHGIAAGLHALISLPDAGPTEADVRRVAAGHGLEMGYLGDRWHAGGDHPQGLVVGYGTPPEHAYPAALDALGRVLRTARREA